MPKKISDLNKEALINYYDEYQRIEVLFSIKKVVSSFNNFGRKLEPSFTIEKLLDDLFFLTWNIRGRYISVLDMRDGLGISPNKLNNEFNNELFILYLQFVLNACIHIDTCLKGNYSILSDKNDLKVIIENVISLLDSLNYKINIVNSEIFVVEKDSYSTAVSEIYEDISAKVIEYKRFNLKGNLERKSEILCTLWKKYEPLREVIKKNNMNKLDGYLGCFFNDITVRHNNIEGRKPNEFVKNLSDAEIEQCYDNTYDLFLLAMLYVNFIDLKPKFEELKSNVDNGK